MARRYYRFLFFLFWRILNTLPSRKSIISYRVHCAIAHATRRRAGSPTCSRPRRNCRALSGSLTYRHYFAYRYITRVCNDRPGNYCNRVYNTYVCQNFASRTHARPSRLSHAPWEKGTCDITSKLRLSIGRARKMREEQWRKD